MTLYEHDRAIGVQPLCGVDEAGRGPLAGPVYAAAAILPLEIELEGLNDSKKLTEKKREALYEQIKEAALDYCVATASVEEIDKLNILQATFLAMKRAVDGLRLRPQLVLIDGNKNPDVGAHSRCVVKGDGASASIAAASILAKVERDRYMKQLDEQYPAYCFAKHKGYGTKLHHEKIVEYGISPAHRRSFLVKLAAKEPALSLYHGEYGEKVAYSYLKQKGFEVIGRNYRCAYGEIDLIARKGEILSFVEVKLRDKTCLYAGREAVTKAKQEKIIKTALHFLQEHPTKLQPRFDVVEITMLDRDQLNIYMIENAFCAEGDYAFI